MLSFFKRKFSESVNGKGIKVVATNTLGTPIHAANTSTTAGTFDRIWIFAQNNHTAAVNVTIQFGDRNAESEITYSVPSKSGMTLCTAHHLQNNALVRAYASVTGAVTLDGFADTIADTTIGTAGTFTVNAVYGYFAGGENAGGQLATADRLTYSTGTCASNTVSNLSAQRTWIGGLSDKINYGYRFTGYNNLDVADRITFSTGATSANTASKLSTQRYLYSRECLSDGNLYGYIAGGSTGGADRTEIVDRLTFATSVTSANTASNMSTTGRQPGSMKDPTQYGYFCGRGDGGNDPAVTTDRIVFSTSITSANTVSNCVVARYDCPCLSDGTTYGYMSGGYTTNVASTANTERMTFSTGVFASNTVSNLSATCVGSGTSSDGVEYGYEMGGYKSSLSAVCDRLTYSTGVMATRTASNLPSATAFRGGLSDFAI